MNDTYFVAQWLAYNHEDIKYLMSEKYEIARGMPSEEGAEYIKNLLLMFFCVHHKEFPQEEAMIAFEDDRVLIVINRYYTKEFFYEH